MPDADAPSAATASSVATSPSPVRPARLDSVDLLRGLIMIVMALDHTRDFFHFGAIHGADPLDLRTTTPAIFLTRWITHFCAPIFSFLAGTGVFLSLTRGKSKREASWFLVTRGLWLIALELTVLVWFGWDFNIDLHRYVLATLWALGTSMIALAALIHLPWWAITTFGLVLVCGHNAFDAIKPESLGGWGNLWRVLHVSGNLQLGSLHVFAFYPMIPWIGLMPLGYAFGRVLEGDAATRRRRLLLLGAVMTAGFVLLRASNLYGNLHPWTHQARPGYSVLSFLDATKYPPSLCYVMMTLGPALLLLAWFDRGTPKLLQPALVFGRVPMFYYLLHIPLLHGLAVLANFARFGRADWMYGSGNATPPPDAGWSLPWVYLVWLTVVVGLYPVCRWFADVKRRRKEAWLSYF